MRAPRRRGRRRREDRGSRIEDRSNLFSILDLRSSSFDPRSSFSSRRLVSACSASRRSYLDSQRWQLGLCLVIVPESPQSKSRQPLPPPTRVTACALDYAELDVTSNFSFLRGASHPDELVYSAAEMGYRAIALTDRNTLAGVVRAHAAAKSCGMKLLVGSRLTLTDGPELLVWAPDRDSYGRLCRLLTFGKQRVEKGEFQLSVEEFVAQSEGLIVAVDGTEETKCELVETKRRRDGETKCALVETE